VEDQLRLWHMAVDTITRLGVKKGIVDNSADGTCCNLIGCHRRGTVKLTDCECSEVEGGHRDCLFLMLPIRMNKEVKNVKILPS
jgi:hypothetical protein